MKGFDFGQIGEVVSQTMDTDYIDIKRNIEGSLIEVYSNVSCHIAYASIDNPDPTTVDIRPIIQAITIHLPLWVDIRNDDFIIAKKIDSDGAVAGIYSGRCGNPVVSMGRKKVLMQMGGTEPDQPTPVPPSNPIQITVNYTNYNEIIAPSTQHLVESGDTFTMVPPAIEGYTFAYYTVDEVMQEGSTVVISNVVEPHTVELIYAVASSSDVFRFLVNGLYTKNDGTLANGWHTYVPVAVDSISSKDGIYTITSDNVVFEHEDNGKELSVKPDALLVLYPDKTFVKVEETTVAGNKVTFTATEFAPTEAQSDYYETRWYD